MKSGSVRSGFTSTLAMVRYMEGKALAGWRKRMMGEIERRKWSGRMVGFPGEERPGGETLTSMTWGTFVVEGSRLV